MDRHYLRHHLLNSFKDVTQFTSEDNPATRDLNVEAAYQIGYEETIDNRKSFRLPRWQDVFPEEEDKWNDAYKLGHDDALGDLILYGIVECSKCNRDLNGYHGPLCRYCDGTAE